MTELNKLKVRLFVEAVLNDGRLELIDELVAADYVGHLPCREPGVLGPDGVRRPPSPSQLKNTTRASSAEPSPTCGAATEATIG